MHAGSIVFRAVLWRACEYENVRTISYIFWEIKKSSWLIIYTTIMYVYSSKELKKVQSAPNFARIVSKFDIYLEVS
jgi:hypothetical protein